MRRKGLHKPKSRIVSALLALFMLFGTTTAIVTVTSAPPAHADTGGYSWSDATTLKQSTYDWGYATCPSSDTGCKSYSALLYTLNGTTYGEADPWGYALRNCTSFVAEKISQEFSGRSVAGWGDAANWAYAATHNGNNYTLDSVSSPQVGDIAVWSTEVGSHGHVAYVASVSNGVATFDEYNVAGTGAYTNNYTSANHPGAQAAPDWYIHMGTPADGSGSGGGSGPISSLPDGTYIQASDNSTVYIMAGGSAMKVYAWANVGGSHSISYTYTQAQITQQGLLYPRDGTVVRDAVSGALFVVAGGFPFGVTSTSAVPSSYSSPSVYVNVDANAITHLRSQPADGTAIRDYGTGGLYVISGGAPVYVHDSTKVPYTTWINVDNWDLVNELQTYPVDGSIIINDTGAVYVVAGGAPMRTMSLSSIPPYTSFAYVDSWAITNMFPAFPRNGTMVRDYVHQNIYVVAGGSLMLVSSLNNVPYTTYVNISDWAIANEFLQYPEDGTVIQDYVHKTVYIVVGGSPLYVTSSNAVPPADMTNAVPIDPNSFTQLLGYPMNGPFVVGYVSGRVYQIQNQTAVYISNSSLITSTPIPVDDWAITNELHGS